VIRQSARRYELAELVATFGQYAKPKPASTAPANRRRDCGLEIAVYLAEGKLKYRAHKLEGLESAVEGINLLFSGGNKGKLMVEL